MYKISSKILSFFVLLVFVISSFWGHTFPVLAEDVDTAKIMTNLRVLGQQPIENLEDGTKVYAVNTGASVSLYANFEVSGTDVDITNATVKIWMPKDGNPYIQSVKFAGSFNASSVVLSGDKDPNEFSVSYKFNRFRGGMVGGYPFSFKFENMITPPNIEQPVYFSIYDENGDLVFNKEEKVIIRSKATTNYAAAKYVYTPKIKNHSYKLGEDYLESNAPTETPSDPEETKVYFYNQFLPLGTNTGGDQGEYRANKVKVVDTLPEGAVFLENDPLNIQYGWTRVDEHTYETVLEKSNPQHARLFTNKDFSVPIVLGFPNKEVTDFPSGHAYAPGKTTATFTNTSNFYYYIHDGEREQEVEIHATEEERSASVSFYYKKYVEPRPVNTSYNWNRQILQGRENFVTIDNDPYEAEIKNGNSIPNLLHVPIMDFVNVHPEKNDNRPVWKAVTDVNQYTRQGYTYEGESLKRILDTNQNVRTQSTGFRDDGTYATNIMNLNSARMYYQDLVVRAERLKNATADASDSLEEIKQAKFWVFKSFSPQFGGNYYAATSDEKRSYNSGQYVRPTVLVPVTDHPFGLNEVIPINDMGGYYTAILMIATDDLTADEVQAIKNQSLVPWTKVIEEYEDQGTTKWRLKGLENNTGEEHSLKLKNVHLQQEFTFRPVKEGNISKTENNTLFRAPHTYDFLARFREDVLQAKRDDNVSTNPASIAYSLNLFATIAGNEFDQVRPSRYFQEENIVQDFAIDTEYRFYPNNAKINLTVSGDQSYLYVDADPEHTGNFTAKIFDVRQDLTAKNIKGIVLLPPGVEYISTHSFGESLGEPEIIDNFKNTGRQAIVYSFGDIEIKSSEEKSLGTIAYTVKVTKRTKDSSTTQEGNPVETWLSWDNPDTIWATQAQGNGLPAVDSADLNQNANRDDILLKGKYDLFYFAPAEVIVSKYVSDADHVNVESGETAGDWSAWTYDSRFIDIGTDVYYRTFLVNQYIRTIDKLTIVERLPSIQDHKMVANQDGIYPLRGPDGNQTGSSFPVYLTQKLGEFQPNIDQDLFDFAYTLAPILSDAENPDAYAEKDIVAEDQWITEADLDSKLAELGKTMADITGFRAILKEGRTISGISEENRVPEGENPIQWYQNHPQSGNTASIYLPAKLPYDTSLDRNIPAYMSTAYKLAKPQNEEYRSFSLTEGNEVRISNIYYTVSGTVFRDYKHTGDLTSDRFSHIKATLEFAEATTVDGVTYQAGDEVPAKLVRKGYVRDENRIEPLEDEEPSNTTYTNEEGNYYFVVYKRGKYQVRFETNPQEERQSFVQYGSNIGNLRANTHAPAPTTYPISPLTTRTRSVMFEASPTVIHYNQNGSIHYLSGSLHNIANAAIDDGKRDFVVFKYGSHEEASSDALRVSLAAKFKLTGVADTSLVREFTTDAATGEYRIEDLPYGDYILEELEAPQGLVKLDHPIQITVSGQGITFDPANPDAGNYEYLNERVEVRNLVPKGRITIVKTSSVKANKPLANVVFGIYQNGKAVVDEHQKPVKAITNEEGRAVFEHLPAGTIYTIKEETPAEGYTTKWQKTEEEIIDLKEGTTVALPLEEDAHVSLSFNNMPFMATIKVKKADEHQRPLAGTKFGLYDDENPDVVLMEATTNALGIATFEGVYTGNYTVKEIEATAGYAKVDVSYHVSVIRDGAIYWVPRQGASIENQEIRGNLRFIKVDEEGNPLQGVTFDLYKGETATGDILNSVTTDETGVVAFQNLLHGVYTLKESVTPDGYASVADLTVSIEENGKTVTLGTEGKVVNEKIKGSIRFIKVDEDGYRKDPKEIKPLEGAIFKLYKARLQESAEGSTYVKAGEAIMTITTGKDGVVLFTNVPYGHYLIEEEMPAAGYNGSSTLLPIQISEHAKTVSPTEDGYFTNKIITGSLSFKKTDEKGKALAGAKFKLANENISYEATSDEEGNVHFADLLYGSYKLTELSAPQGYALWKGNKTVTIETQGVEVTVDKIENTLIRGSIEIHKKDASDQTALANASFKIYRGLDEEGHPIDAVEKEGSAYTVSTNHEGKATFENLPYGTYYLQETQAPEGYVLSTEVKEVKILENKEESYTIEFTNKKIRGSVEITKQDARTSFKIKGAKFKLYQLLVRDGEEVLGEEVKEGELTFEASTDENGLAVLEDIPYGRYFVKEIEAPHGYRLLEEPIKMSITEQGKPQKITVHNEKQEAFSKLPIT